MEEETKKEACCAPSGKERHVAKVAGFVIALALALFVGITALGIYWPNIQEYKYKMEAEKFQKEIDAARAEILAREKDDTYGGKTPEETFDLFLDALKKNDAELAGKYYDVRVQDEATENLGKEIAERGNLEMSLAYFTDVRKGEKKCNEGGDGCTFEFVFTLSDQEKEKIDPVLLSADGKEKRSISLGANNVAGIWKITLPY